MSSKCNVCSKTIINNSDFITCAGGCRQNFHLKCVSVTKAMFNAVTTCPNIHWYCENCNDNTGNISESLSLINDAVSRLSGTFTGDLTKFLDGFKSLMQNFVVNLNATSCPVGAGSSQPELISDVKSSAPEVIEVKKFSKTGADCSDHFPEVCSVKSVVVSNIGKDVTDKCLKKYLSNKLKIDSEEINVSLLLPPGRTIDSTYFLQYKITFPGSKHSAIMLSNNWPDGVRIRDFVYKQKRVNVVSREVFLSELSQ